MQGYSSSLPGTASARRWLGGQIMRGDRVMNARQNKRKDSTVAGHRASKSLTMMTVFTNRMKMKKSPGLEKRPDCDSRALLYRQRLYRSQRKSNLGPVRKKQLANRQTCGGRWKKIFFGTKKRYLPVIRPP
jgi:hypothetical protein